MTCKIDGKEYKLIEIERNCKEWNCVFVGEIITTIFKCPLCGKGTARRVDEDTPGDRSHDFYIDCEECNPGHYVFERDHTSYNCMHLRTRTPIEVAKAAIQWEEMKKRGEFYGI